MWYPSKDHLDRVKVSLDILTVLLVVGFVLFAVSRPAQVVQYVQTALAEANLKLNKMTALGLEFSFDDQGTALQEVRASLTEVTELLVCREADNCSESQLASIAELTGPGLTALPPPIAAVVRRLDEEVAQIETARAAMTDDAEGAGAAAGIWLVVTGADRQIEPARFEVAKLEDAGFGAELLRLGGWYRTVVPFDGEPEARAALGDIEAAAGRAAYLQPFGSFCPNPEPQEGFTACAGSE